MHTEPNDHEFGPEYIHPVQFPYVYGAERINKIKIISKYM